MTDDAGELIATIQGRSTIGRQFEIRRSGKLKREGGAGVKWTCSCGGPITRHKTLCEHINDLFTGRVIENDAPWQDRDPWRPLVALTPLGEELLRPRWAALALAGPQPKKSRARR